ncbi:hypothetical protein [Limosilactobacillus vaginalis]|uniref:hypothetical protein n=1 Tax=Limosilactobacillus vaginalis TaxID=1633 RepID=UPI00241FFA82|nr:hypothetical protein [Limosilactobacillus vaginalis]
MTEKIIDAAGKKHNLTGFDGLVFVHGLNEEPFTTDKVISKCSKNQLQVVKNLVRNHKQDLEEFGGL